MKRDHKKCTVKKSLPLSTVYRLLEPGPVVLVTTVSKGKTDIMALSWHMMIDFEPPVVGCVISNRNHTFSLVKETSECVINITTVELAAQVVGCGNTSGRWVDKFKSFGLTPAPAARRRSSSSALPISNARSSIWDGGYIQHLYQIGRASCRERVLASV